MIKFLIAIVVLITLIVLYKMYKKTETLVNATRQVTLYYADFCPACTAMKPVWEKVKQTTAGSGVIFREVDVQKTPTPGINSIPTIIMIDTNGKSYEYFSGPDHRKLHKWVLSPARLW
ncbi:hypothetical protein PV-S19_0117 [Pacmanvirus S19]|nr:hypothetical protein PV-S19_0117 [Pacmanvirus S19]